MPPKIILNAPTKLMKKEGEKLCLYHDEPEGFQAKIIGQRRRGARHRSARDRGFERDPRPPGTLGRAQETGTIRIDVVIWFSARRTADVFLVIFHGQTAVLKATDSRGCAFAATATDPQEAARLRSPHDRSQRPPTVSRRDYYQLHVKSFDANNDGIGIFGGLTCLITS
jgi:hypothetical protein